MHLTRKCIFLLFLTDEGGIATLLYSALQPVAGLIAATFLDEVAFLDEAGEEVAEAVLGENEAAGVFEFASCDGGLLGKEVGEDGVDVYLRCGMSPTDGRLINFEGADVAEQFAVGLEAQAVDTHVLAMVVPVAHLDITMQGEGQGANAGDGDGATLAHLMQQQPSQFA